MADFRLTARAEADIASLLATSLERWGEDAHGRYAALLDDAFAALIVQPFRPTTRQHPGLPDGIRSFHVQHVRGSSGVKSPVHVIYYRYVDDVLEVLRVLHERAEPVLHFGTVRGRPR